MDIDKWRQRGYKDYKYMLYGNNASGALSFHINIKTTGKAYICEPASNLGQYPAGLRVFWEVGMKVYLSSYSPLFKFHSSQAVELKYTPLTPPSANSCVELNEQLPVGDHVLSIVAISSDYVGICYLLLP
jgi:hypothetical protein